MNPKTHKTGNFNHEIAKMRPNKLLKKVFGSMKHELYTKLFHLLQEAPGKYLEQISAHTDAIHWHLNKIDISNFEQYLIEYFVENLKYLRKTTCANKMTIAFDETFVPFYGKAQDNWVVSYNNNVKGATGSYKFMVCSIIIEEKRYVLAMLPMHNNSNTNKIVEIMLNIIKRKFHIETVLFDRGFCNKKLCRELGKQGLQYLILCPKWTNIKRYLKENKDEVIETVLINEHKTKNKFDWRFVFVHNYLDHDWAFATNMQMKGTDLVKLYKCRWGIETNFRVMDESDIKSKSKNIVTRCFFFFMSIIFFNSWLELDKDISFATYLDSQMLANLTLKELVDKRIKAKKLLNMKITEEDLLKVSSFRSISTNFGLNPTWFRFCEIGVA